MWAAIFASALLAAPVKVQKHLEIAESSMTATATLTITNADGMSYDFIKGCVSDWLEPRSEQDIVYSYNEFGYTDLSAAKIAQCITNQVWVEVTGQDNTSGDVDVLVVVKGPYAVDCLFKKTAQKAFPKCAQKPTTSTYDDYFYFK